MPTVTFPKTLVHLMPCLAEAEVESRIPHAFGRPLRQWDACFMALWSRWSPGTLQDRALNAIDQFYASQHPDGAICRLLPGPKGDVPNKAEADDSWQTPANMKHSAFTNPPLFSWVEWEHYTFTGDESRLPRVLPILGGYFDWYARSRSRSDGAFWWDPVASGMSGVPRRSDAHGWVDYTAQAALDCEFLGNIAHLVGDGDVGASCAANYLGLKEYVNENLWHELSGHYSDVDADGLWVGPLHVGCYWPLLASLAPPDRVEAMTKHLLSYRAFARAHAVPSVAAHERGFSHKGAGWTGGVYSSTTYMVVRALERSGNRFLAHTIALNHLTNCAAVFEKTGKLWEYYAPDAHEPGEGAKVDERGLTALALRALLFESVVGIVVDGALREVTWHLQLEVDHEVKGVQVGPSTVDLKAVWRNNGWDVVATPVAVPEPVFITIATRAGRRRVELTATKPQMLRSA